MYFRKNIELHLPCLKLPPLSTKITPFTPNSWFISYLFSLVFQYTFSFYKACTYIHIHKMVYWNEVNSPWYTLTYLHLIFSTFSLEQTLFWLNFLVKTMVRVYKVVRWVFNPHGFFVLNYFFARLLFFVLKLGKLYLTKIIFYMLKIRFFLKNTDYRIANLRNHLFIFNYIFSLNFDASPNSLNIRIRGFQTCIWWFLNLGIQKLKTFIFIISF